MDNGMIQSCLKKEIQLQNPLFFSENSRDIGFGVDDRYVRYMIASMISFCENSGQTFIHFHVVTNTISEINIERIRYVTERYTIKVSLYFFDIDVLCSFPVIHKGLSIATYFRFFLPYCIKQVHKLLYVDADIICNKNLDDLFSFDLRDYAVAAVPDMEIMKRKRNCALGFRSEHQYFNAGVLLINIDYWAKLDLFEDIMEIVQTYRERIQFEDQDVLNILFKEKVFYLPPVYNCIDMLHANCMNAKLLHFASQPKPWSKWWRLNPNCNQHNKDIYQRYENLSGTLYPQTDKYDIKLLMKSLIKFFLYRYLPGRVQKYEM